MVLELRNFRNYNEWLCCEIIYSTCIYVLIRKTATTTANNYTNKGASAQHPPQKNYFRCRVIVVVCLLCAGEFCSPLNLSVRFLSMHYRQFVGFRVTAEICLAFRMQKHNQVATRFHVHRVWSNATYLFAYLISGEREEKKREESHFSCVSVLLLWMFHCLYGAICCASLSLLLLILNWS